jgi:hypothetical protein
MIHTNQTIDDLGQLFQRPRLMEERGVFQSEAKGRDRRPWTIVIKPYCTATAD